MPNTPAPMPPRSLKRGITRTVNSGFTKGLRGAVTPTTGQLWPRGAKRGGQ